jgi:hypothetical protein
MLRIGNKSEQDLISLMNEIEKPVLAEIFTSKFKLLNTLF